MQIKSRQKGSFYYALEEVSLKQQLFCFGFSCWKIPS